MDRKGALTTLAAGTDDARRSADQPPRVLAVTSEPPWPLDSGGHLRSFYLLKALAAHTRLRIVCPVQPHQESAVAALAAAGLDLRPVSVPPRSARHELRRLVSATLRGEPYVMYRRHHWPDAHKAWRAELQHDRPALLYLDHLDSLMYALDSPSAPVPAVVDLHNIYSVLARRAADEHSRGWKHWWLGREARHLDRVERRLARSPLTLFAVSDGEADYFRRLGAPDVHAVPNGVDCASRADLPTGRSGRPVVLFLGTMSWGPNVSAARFLARTVFPAVRARVPDASLLIVGANPPAEIRDLHGGAISVTGRVPDVKPYLAEASVLAVPLDAGGGTRLKILEAFASGLPVISTRIGAEGLAAEPGTHYGQAERPDFAGAVADLLGCPAAGTRLAQAARALVRRTYDWQLIGERAAAHVLAAAGRQPASAILEGRSGSPGRAPGDPDES
jgi:glycosyltransferase involved in cell wall biosynthesis